MSESKHTPGPWIAEEGGREPNRWLASVRPVAPRHGLVAHIYDKAPREAADANARLIAAAPDLLAALTTPLGLVNGGDDFASDLEVVASFFEWQGLPDIAEAMRRRVEAILDAVARAKGE